MIDMLPSALCRGLALLGLPLKWPHPTLRGNHLAAAGRLVKVPAFVLMYERYIGRRAPGSSEVGRHGVPIG